MGRGFQVFEQPAHAAPRLTPREATPYVHNDLQLFASRYPGRDWENNTLVNKGDKGLRVEVHRYRRMMDEMTDKEAERHPESHCCTHAGPTSCYAATVTC